jgi:hypothetical protein
MWCAFHLPVRPRPYWTPCRACTCAALRSGCACWGVALWRPSLHHLDALNRETVYFLRLVQFLACAANLLAQDSVPAFTWLFFLENNIFYYSDFFLVFCFYLFFFPFFYLFSFCIYFIFLFLLFSFFHFLISFFHFFYLSLLLGNSGRASVALFMTFNGYCWMRKGKIPTSTEFVMFPFFMEAARQMKTSADCQRLQRHYLPGLFQMGLRSPIMNGYIRNV